MLVGMCMTPCHSRTRASAAKSPSESRTLATTGSRRGANLGAALQQQRGPDVAAARVGQPFQGAIVPTRVPFCAGVEHDARLRDDRGERRGGVGRSARGAAADRLSEHLQRVALHPAVWPTRRAGATCGVLGPPTLRARSVRERQLAAPPAGTDKNVATVSQLRKSRERAPLSELKTGSVTCAEGSGCATAVVWF